MLQTNRFLYTHNMRIQRTFIRIQQSALHTHVNILCEYKQKFKHEYIIRS